MAISASVNEILSDEQKEVMEREMRYRAHVMRDMAKMLAESGGLPHREKNEVILRVIGMLLVYADPAVIFTRRMEDGDIPF